MKRAWYGTLLALLPIVALAVYYFASSPTNGDFWWYDSSRHAMNGVFLRDFVMEGGLLHPIHFSSTYYEKYPGINIGFYPPFFFGLRLGNPDAEVVVIFLEEERHV